jgi:hypothetical protein
MGYGNHMIDRCVIFRYKESVDDGVTQHEPEKLYSGVHCRLIQRNTRDMDEHGRTKIISTYTLLLLSGTDIQPGDLVQVNDEIINDKPVRYEVSKPYSPNRHHIRAILNEEVER